MLKLKKLQLQGFKSFCDRTEVTFSGAGVAAIVGPNGCGKSNIADAIGWVLGEQSAKSLRGVRMEDVIFAGTRERPATGFAEVSLTLINPAEYQPESQPDAELEPEAPPADQWEEAGAAAEGHGVVLSIRRRRVEPVRREGEIVVTRRLYRAGESEYLMNGRACRLRDIHDLFLGTGLGPDCYAILSQGHIEQILSSKPYDRRAVIEEAAGVSKYKVRRRLAEAKLEQARQNLGRINDIFEEVTRQVGSLKRQAAKAERYRGLKAEYDARQRDYLRARAQAWQAGWQAVQTELEESRALVAAAQRELAEGEAARSERARRALELEQELRQASEVAAQFTRELDRTTQQLAFHEQQELELTRRAADVEAETARIREQHQRLEADRVLAESEQGASAAAVAEAESARALEHQAHQEAQSRVAGLESGIESARQEMLQLLARLSALSNRRAQGDALVQGYERDRQRIGGEQAAAAAELQAAGELRERLLAENGAQASAGAALADRLAAREREAATLRQQESAGRSRLDQARTDLAEIGARRRSLEELVEHHGYSSEAVRKLFQSRDQAQDFTPMGLLGEYLEVDARYESVIEEFLRDELNYVVVRNWDQAGAGVSLLRTQAEGRATFLVEAPVAAAAGTGMPLDPPAEPGLVPLAGEVRLNNGFKGRLDGILPRLRHAYLTSGRDQAQRLAHHHPSAFFLTEQGECFHACTVAAGTGAATGPLRLKRELGERARQERELNARAAEWEADLTRVAAEAAAAGQEIEQLRQARHELEKQLLVSSQAAREAESASARLSGQVRALAADSERNRIEHQAAQAELLQLAEQLRQTEAVLAERRGGEAEAQRQAAAARAEREQAAARLAERQSELARREERARGARANAERIAALVGELAQQLAAHHAERERLAQRRTELVSLRGQCSRRLLELRESVVAADARRSALEVDLDAARAAIAAVEVQVAAAREALEQCRQRHNESEIAAARLEADLRHLQETCRAELNCELDQLTAETVEAVEAVEAVPVDLPALEEAVRALRVRIENLGPVNMLSLEEYEEVRQRHAFMEAQRTDLIQSIADTQRVIEEIDTVSRQQFNEAFERINAYFQETFRILFGGGQGTLQLTQLEGQSDCGIDIIAQPPGKKLQNVLLLSGGEKSMTALALLLAIFRYQPSPFCLLDEADAALDEANVARFGAIIREMADETQFILITHNKRTMDCASTLYGVTMPQAGVSRLVSVNLEKPDRRAAAV